MVAMAASGTVAQQPAPKDYVPQTPAKPPVSAPLTAVTPATVPTTSPAPLPVQPTPPAAPAPFNPNAPTPTPADNRLLQHPLMALPQPAPGAQTSYWDSVLGTNWFQPTQKSPPTKWDSYPPALNWESPGDFKTKDIQYEWK